MKEKRREIYKSIASKVSLEEHFNALNEHQILSTLTSFICYNQILITWIFSAILEEEFINMNIKKFPVELKFFLHRWLRDIPDISMISFWKQS